jgi:haloalkane dehalogenase
MALKKALATPEACFADLEGYPFDPHYVEVTHPDYQPLRMHYIDEGQSNARETILCLHGCPAWSYLYRKMVPLFVQQGYRVIAPDHIGCGKSDKLLDRQDYSYSFYVDCIESLITQLFLENITLVAQDWGGPIGLRNVTRLPELFSRLVVANTLLPNCEAPPLGVDGWPGDIINNWINFTRNADDLPVGGIIQGVTVSELDKKTCAAYDAPFPDASFKQGILQWPSLIPVEGTMAGVSENREAWQILEQLEIPCLVAFSDQDPSTAAWATVFESRMKNTSSVTINNGGHMLQEDQGETLARAIINFMG